MKEANIELVKAVLVAIEQGTLPDTLVTHDMAAWTLTSGDTDKEKFAGGVKLLSIVFGGTLKYSVDRVVADGDDVWLEAQSNGRLIDGQSFHNHHIFQFHVDGGLVSEIREYMNPIIVEQKLLPLFQQVAAQAAKGA